MKKILFVLLVTMFVLVTSCSDNNITSVSEGDEEMTENVAPELPSGFQIENELSIPNIDSLNSNLLDKLKEIGVEDINYIAYGNYRDESLFLSVDIFVLADDDAQLLATFMAFFDDPWECSFIRDASNKEKYYYVSGINSSTVDIYDYKTGLLISGKNMTHDELQDEIQRQEEEADENFQEALDSIAEAFGGK